MNKISFYLYVYKNIQQLEKACQPGSSAAVGQI